MAKTWATSAGIDLHLDLAGTRVRAGLESALRDAVCDGRLTAGTRLPSSRALAADLGVARNTVADAYGQLVAEGWLTARHGSGTYVAPRVAAVAPPATNRPAVVRRPRYDLSPGTPNLSAFPRSAWLAAARRALAAAPDETLGYTEPAGLVELRAALVEYLARTRGVRARAENVVICSGFTQGLALLCRALRDRGAGTLAVEGHGLTGITEAAATVGLGVTRVVVDEEGARIDGLGQADAALLTPAHQFPLGVSLSPRRRAAAVAWARGRDAVLIEDDYDGEFRYDRHPLGAMQALAPSQIVYAGTASKTLAPGLRLAWLVVPDELLPRVVAAKAQADRHTSVIDQLTLAEFIRSGGYDRHIRRSRIAYRRRRDRLVGALAAAAPEVRVSGIAAGLHVLVELAAGDTERAAVARAADRGLALEGLSGYADAASDRRPAVVIGYAKPPEHAFTGAIARLCATLTSVRPPRV